MRIINSGTVFLEKGEVVPVFCPCGEVYQPDRGSFASKCPKCGYGHIHGEQDVVKKHCRTGRRP